MSAERAPRRTPANRDREAREQYVIDFACDLAEALMGTSHGFEPDAASINAAAAITVAMLHNNRL